jgi:heme exporter protein A
VLSTLTAPTQGELHLLGRRVDRAAAATLRARIGMIGHQPMLYGDLSAEENLVFFGSLYGVANPRRRAADLLERVGLADRVRDAAKTFSRGMTQRLAIARGLMHEPDLIPADEPFSGLDLPSSQKLEELLAGLHGSGKTIVLVNHDLAQSLRLAQRVVVLRRGRVAGDHASEKTSLETVVAEVTAP